MLLTEEEKRKIEEEEKFRAAVRAKHVPKHKSVLSLNVAYVLNLILPGVGHVYLGNVSGGIVMFLIAACGLPFAGIPTVIIWIYVLASTRRIYNKFHVD